MPTMGVSATAPSTKANAGPTSNSATENGTNRPAARSSYSPLMTATSVATPTPPRSCVAPAHSVSPAMSESTRNQPGVEGSGVSAAAPVAAPVDAGEAGSGGMGGSVSGL